MKVMFLKNIPNGQPLPCISNAPIHVESAMLKKGNGRLYVLNKFMIALVLKPHGNILKYVDTVTSFQTLYPEVR